jgi:hypothetical protein
MAKKKPYDWSVADPVPMSFKHVGIDGANSESAAEIRAAMRLFGGQEIVTRSLEQNDCLHKWCREISNHLKANGANVTEETVKELILNCLGNVKVIEVPGLPKKEIAMRSSRYKQLPSDLSEAEKRMGFISMNELLCKVEVWAATDLQLVLSKEEKVCQEQSEHQAASISA